MQRIPEPELMTDDEQANAYAEADFEEPHSAFVQKFCDCFPATEISGYVLDLGCGTADISRRFAQRFPQCRVDGVDGSDSMLCYGAQTLEKYNLSERVRLIKGYLPGAALPEISYDAIISNSLLHHLAEPDVLWQSIRQYGHSGAPVFVMDLLRPESMAQASSMVRQYAGDEPAVLQKDFYNSLLAAYSIHEIQAQLRANDLTHLKTQTISDRHFIVWGYL